MAEPMPGNLSDARRLEARFLVVTLILTGFLAFLVVHEFIYFMAGGILLVFAFYPVHRRIRKRVRSQSLAAFLSFMIVVLVVVGPLVLVVVLVYNDAVAFAKNYNPNTLNQTIQGFLDSYGVGSGDGEEPSKIANSLGQGIQSFAKRVGAGLLSVLPNLAMGMVIAGFVIYYGFSEGETFYRTFRYWLPIPDEIEEPLFSEIRKVTSVVFIGTILTSALGGVVGTITFFMFGIPNAIFWGFIMIILGILPLLGAPLVWIPAGLYLFVQGHAVSAIALLAINGLLVIGYVDNILRPKLIGKVAGVHPILVLVGVLGGLEAFGALGFVIGPLVLSIFIALIRSYTNWHPRWQGRMYSDQGDTKPIPGHVMKPLEDKPVGGASVSEPDDEAPRS